MEFSVMAMVGWYRTVFLVSRRFRANLLEPKVHSSRLGVSSDSKYLTYATDRTTLLAAFNSRNFLYVR
ncbi:hypothetical protein PanWU01x14_250480 [Parasponia andersonii]|uniref:Uncharacterized protein n=1 Tax=Parasponia andersonii TaxID=3476 RepID=A0A2P5BCX0_PARAD|nr:hypothetical protein PanWU01x14_250480 [Parasponia andersonii]